jgi:thiol-disulfide isomerase/thioredoxin
VPADAIARLEARFQRPQQPLTEEELKALFMKRMDEVVQEGEKIEREYPGAPNLQRVRNVMLRAVNLLAQASNDPSAQKQLLAISTRIMNSRIPQAEKAQADFFLTLDRIQPSGAQTAPDAARQVRDFVARYQGTQAAPAASYYGVLLAQKADDPKLAEELMQAMDARYPDNPLVRASLRRLGWFVGRPFTAELTRLDGTPLSLPRDVAGKIVVIDFWATWCPPCVASMPKVKAAQAKLKAQGVEFVSISLDENREALDSFVRENKMDWTQTFTGKGWEDPTAVGYGVNSIPSMWVLGKDGKVISDNVRADEAAGTDDTRLDLYEVVKKAATQPAEK